MIVPHPDEERAPERPNLQSNVCAVSAMMRSATRRQSASGTVVNPAGAGEFARLGDHLNRFTVAVSERRPQSFSAPFLVERAFGVVSTTGRFH